jgi:CheY-like chemotaxis protein
MFFNAIMAVPQVPPAPAGTLSKSEKYATDSGPFLETLGRMALVACKVMEPIGGKQEPVASSAGRKFRGRAENFPPQVLVVDDEPLIRWSVAESLSALGFAVQNAKDASTALRIVTTSPLPIQVVVLDLRLPDMHDLSLLATLRQLMPSAHLVLMTAYGTPQVLAEARALGADVLVKPFELTELSRLVLEH